MGQYVNRTGMKLFAYAISAAIVALNLKLLFSLL
jgi:hypothetical protein